MDAGTPLSGSVAVPAGGFGAMTDEIAAMSSDAARRFRGTAQTTARAIGVVSSLNLAGGPHRSPVLFGVAA